MKVVAVMGSPQKNGNSSTLTKKFCEAAEKKGAEVDAFYLNTLQFQGCQACMTCKTKLDHCVLQDDLTAVLNAVSDADVLVMATPVYYGDVCGQLKLFIDRTFSYLVPDFQTNPNPSRLAPGKKLIFIVTQAGKTEMFADIFPRYENFFKWYGFTEIRLLRGCDLLASGIVKENADLLQQAEDAAQEMLG